MATQTQQAEQHRLTQAAIAAAFIQAVRELWRSLDPWSMLDSAPEFQRDLYRTVTDYSAAAIKSTADRFELMRSEAGETSRRRLPVVQLPSRTEVDETFRVLTSDLWQPRGTEPVFMDAVTSDAEYNLGESLADKVVDTGRREMEAAIRSEPRPPLYARVIRPGCCYFCAMLASRGAVYASSDTAGTGRLFHPNCRCQVVPVFNARAYRESETVRAATAIYVAGRGDEKAFRKSWEDENAPPKPARPKSQGFDSLSLDQIQHQIGVTEPLKDSEWRTKQLERLRKRAAELSAAA